MTKQRGAAGQQYAIVVGLIAVVAIAAIGSVGGSIRSLFVSTGNRLSNAASLDGGTGSASTATASTTGSRFFMINGTTTGNMGGIAGGDAICANDTAKPADGRTYIAFLSTASVAAPSRTTLVYPIRQAANPSVIVASNASAFFNGPITMPGDGWVRWTGTNASGGISSLGTCNSWTAGSPQTASAGGWNASSPMTNNSTYDCGSYSGKIYCISTTP